MDDSVQGAAIQLTWKSFLPWTIAVVVVSCSDSNGPGTQVVEVTTSPSDTTVLSGESVDLAATVLTASGAIIDTSIVWRSSDTLFVVVDPNGQALARRPGQAVVTASVGAISGMSTIGVLAFAFERVTSGGAHSCGLTASGSSFCWGDNIMGQLGDGSTTQRPYPVAVRGQHRFTAITSGAGHSCALDQQQAAHCWGGNTAGQLGDGSTTNRSEPGPVSGGHQFVAIDAGAARTCGITVLGQTLCWGGGLLGVGDTLNRVEPAVVSGGLSFRAVSVGSSTCAVTVNDQAYCWGRNTFGAVGDGTTTDRLVPTAVNTGVLFKSISTTASHTCGVSLGLAGSVYCWGRNSVGQIGDGTTTDRSSPVPISGGQSFATVGVGTSHSCGRSSTGAAICWGWNFSGQIGVPWDSLGMSSQPVMVSGGFTFVNVQVGDSHTCGIADDARVHCWGTNAFGRLGIGAPSFGSHLPVPVFGQD